MTPEHARDERPERCERHNRALIYPRALDDWLPIADLLPRLGIEHTADVGDDYDFVIAHDDRTFPDHPDNPVLHRLRGEGYFIVNGDVPNISKTRIEAIHTVAFGYGAVVDASRYAGSIVEKSHRNYRHDGVVLRGPLDPASLQPDKLYMKEIDNRVAGGCEDLRVAVIDRRPCYVVAFYKHEDKRFGSLRAAAYDARGAPPEAFFSRREFARLCRFCAAFGIDCGDLDVLRDHGAARAGREPLIYVVDVNITPGTRALYYESMELAEMWGAMRPESRSGFERPRLDAPVYLERPFARMLDRWVYGYGYARRADS
jgi:hypothetical protein